MINSDSSEEIRGHALTEKKAKKTGFPRRIVWDETKPDGTPCKIVDNTRLHTMGWRRRPRSGGGRRTCTSGTAKPASAGTRPEENR